MKFMPAALALIPPTFAEAASQTVSGDPRPPGLHEINAWSMFMDADPVVKGVIIGLAVASLVTWTIFFAKSLTLWFTRRRLAASLGRLASARTLAEAYAGLKRNRGATYELLRAASEEVRLSRPGASPGDVSGRAMSRFAEMARAETRAVRHGMGALATIGSTAPFVGLFGTVWGIMNSFVGITRLQTTNLAVVAPGIAEALLATACGLAAAIPAVVIYNFLTRQIRVYGDLVNDASGAVARLLSRSVESGETPFGGADRG
jgi:biopolymer transport protein ExbB